MLRDCPSFEGYCVDEHGRVYSRRRRRGIAGHHGGSVAYISGEARALAVTQDRKGYFRVGAYRGRKRVCVAVHRLVADAFHGPRPDGAEIRHLDGNNKNNIPNNLMYGSATENVRDRLKHGGYPTGSDHHNAKLSSVGAASIRARRVAGTPVKTLASEYGVSLSTVESVIYQKSYNALTFEVQK